MTTPSGRPPALLRWRDVYSEAELYRAALRVYTKPLFHWRKACSMSVDRRTLYDFASHGLQRLDVMHTALKRERFTFRPSLALHYNFNGRHRTIYLAPWEERIVDLLLYRVLSRRLHGWFSPDAYAYRIHGLGLDVCQARVARLLRRADAPAFVVKRDVADYFATVHHETLLDQLRAIVDPDDHLMRLLEQRIRFAFLEDAEVQRAEVGIPFGTAVACLLANVYLTPLDRAVAGLPDAHYFRYADDLLLLARSPEVAARGADLIASTVSALRLSLKASHHGDFMLAAGARPAAGVFVPVRQFRHLGLQFRADGAVALARDKLRKIQNLFRFAFRRSRRRWQKIAAPEARAEALSTVAADVLARGRRNVAIVDYYLKHVDDEHQLQVLDRWLAEEVLTAVFGGHRKSHFRRLPFERLRALGLPSLVHRRRLIRRGKIESSLLTWQQDRATRAFRGTAVRRDRPSGGSAFSPHPEAAARQRP